jgi:hypothetical protein
VAGLWIVLSFTGAAIVGMLLSEAHTTASLLARLTVRRSARRLKEPWRSIREEEWLAELDAMEGLHIFRLLLALGIVCATTRSKYRAPAQPRPVMTRGGMYDPVGWANEADGHGVPSAPEGSHQPGELFELSIRVHLGDGLKDVKKK